VRGAPPARPKAQRVAPGAGPVPGPQAVAQQLPMPVVRVSAPAAPQRLPKPRDPQQVVAFQQSVRQQILQTRQQILQRYQQVVQMHQLQIRRVQQ
jgi:hypothetical protein